MNAQQYVKIHREADKASVSSHSNKAVPFDPFDLDSPESALGHLPAAAKWYFFSTTNEVYENPAAIMLTLPEAEGNHSAKPYVFDLLFVDRKGLAVVVEVRRVCELEQLAKEDSVRWLKAKRGAWESPTMEAALRPLGLLHLILTDVMVLEFCQMMWAHPDACREMMSRVQKRKRIPEVIHVDDYTNNADAKFKKVSR